MFTRYRLFGIGFLFDKRKIKSYNEWDGNEWVKKELKEGDSIVITQRDIDEGITRYYRRWFVKDGELQSFEDYVNETFSAITTEFETAINGLKPAQQYEFEFNMEELKKYMEDDNNDEQVL